MKDLLLSKNSGYSRARLAGFICLMLLADSLYANQPPDYLFTDLGNDSYPDKQTNGLGDNGMIVGTVQTNYGNREFHLYEKQLSVDSITTSKTLVSSGEGVNNAGCVVGSTQAFKDASPIYLSIWKGAESCPFNDTTFLNIGLGGLQTHGFAINSSNLVVGSSKTATDESYAFSATIGGSDTTNLGALAGGYHSAALSVNDDGSAVGVSSSAAAAQRATLWDDNGPRDLGTLQGATDNSTTESYANAINNQDLPQVAGWSYGSAAGGLQHAFVWRNGVMTDLGVLPGGNMSEARDINDYGIVVGWARAADFHVYAVAWENGQIMDLNTIEGIPDGWVLAEARSINNLGQITGRGVFQGTDRPFLITPKDAVKNLFFDDFESGDTSNWSVVH